MSAPEVGWRVRDRIMQAVWARRQVLPGQPPPAAATLPTRRPVPPLPEAAVDGIPSATREALVHAADGLLAGRWQTLGGERDDLADPDWFRCPVTGRRAPQSQYAFRIDHRSESVTGNVKQLWELSRHHHVTVLAAAWRISGRDEYADMAARHLRAWWRENPFLSGVNWSTGIEVGVRLISWAWTRRLLAGWPGASDLFEDDPVALAQIRGHQEYLATFRSRGSSSNNHVLAEAAGQLVAACAFPWFPESNRWRETAARLFEAELEHNTFPSGVNRELAFDYHGFVTELGLVAAAEAAAAGHPLSDRAWTTLCRMADVVAACVDETMRPPRQGDDDEGRALLLDAPELDRWSSLLALGERVFGALPWWPAVEPDVRSSLVGALVDLRPARGARPDHRPSHFADAGLTLMRTRLAGGPEIWCRCDGGPHGFLSIAAHAHADALAIEVRHGGVDVLADPGTYCYQSEPRWRQYFRSTAAHNTVEIAGADQSIAGGPFLWLTHADGRVIDVVHDDGGVLSWSAEHDGYDRLKPPVRHRRTVHLDRMQGRLEVIDDLFGAAGRGIRMAWHLGPAIRAELSGDVACLEWETETGSARAQLDLGAELRWSARRGETHPILGWYSAAFGHRVPTTTLLGTGPCPPGGTIRTTLTFVHAERCPPPHPSLGTKFRCAG